MWLLQLITGTVTCWRVLEWTRALSCPIASPLAGTWALVICGYLCTWLCRPAVEEAQGPTAKRRCWGAGRHMWPKGHGSWRSKVSMPWTSSLPGDLAARASLARAQMVTLKKAVGKKARGFSDGWTPFRGSCLQAGALTLVPSLNHNTAESRPRLHLSMDPTKPNSDLRTDFLTWPWICIITMSMPDDLDSQLTPSTILTLALLALLGCLGLSPTDPHPGSRMAMLSVALWVTGWGWCLDCIALGPPTQLLSPHNASPLPGMPLKEKISSNFGSSFHFSPLLSHATDTQIYRFRKWTNYIFWYQNCCFEINDVASLLLVSHWQTGPAGGDIICHLGFVVGKAPDSQEDTSDENSFLKKHLQLVFIR